MHSYNAARRPAHHVPLGAVVAQVQADPDALDALDLGGDRQRIGRVAAYASERRRRLDASDDEAVNLDVHAPDRTMHLRRASRE